jgi:hypothetical protein
MCFFGLGGQQFLESSKIPWLQRGVTIALLSTISKIPAAVGNNSGKRWHAGAAIEAADGRR